MLFVVLSSILLLLVIIGQYKGYVGKEKLKWVRSVPGYPIIGNAFEFHGTAETLNDLGRLHRLYGKTVLVQLLADLLLVSCDYNFLQFILSTTEVLNKARIYEYLHRWLGTGLLTSDVRKWKIRRKLITPAFHFSILEEFIDAFESNGKTLVDKLKKVEGQDVDIYQYITLYTLDVICESAMGVKIRAQGEADSEYVKSVKCMGKIVGERIVKAFEREPVLYPLFPNYYREIRAVRNIHKFSKSVIEAKVSELDNSTTKLNANEKRKKVAFLHLLLQSTIDGEPLSKEDIREEVDTFMFEGHDTTASGISFGLYLLAKHQDVQSKALKEQENIFSGDISRPATLQDLQQMKYLESVIKETLRTYPPVPLYMRGTTEDVAYKGNVIPKGVTIVINAYEIMRDPEYFPNPEKFDPDRFESVDGSKPYAYIPFSAGPRNCIGQKFAMLEMKSTLSKMLRNFHLLPTDPEHQVKITVEAVLKSTNGIKIKLKKRTW